jgi:hypothetical protein
MWFIRFRNCPSLPHDRRPRGDRCGLFAGFGEAYRKLLDPGQQDNAVEVSLTYEPDYRWFKGREHTSPDFVVPSDSYEGRVHARLRRDALERNTMKLPHRG